MQGSTRKLDVLVLLADLHKQATVERSHYYVGKVVSLAIDEIGSLRAALNIKEARPTVRAKRPVQQRKHAICARGGKGHYVACRYWHSVGCSYRGKCPHKQHAIA